MTLAEDLINDFDSEAKKSRNLLAAVPGDKLDWKPHEKSMTLGALAGHIAEMPMWVGSMMEPDMDMGAMMADYKPFVPATGDELSAGFEKNLGLFAECLTGKGDAFMREVWTMRSGEKVLMSSPRNEVVREVLLHHLAHHRGQLTVYLRLLDVPVPATYGGTADESGL